MAKMKVSGKVSKAKKKLQVGLGELEKAIKAETEGLSNPQEAKRREAEIRDMFFTARKKTKGLQSGILMGLFGDEVGQALANVFAKEDPSKVKSAQQFFKKYQKNEKPNIVRAQKAQIAKLIGRQQDISTGSDQIQLKEGFYYDQRVGARGGIRNVRTGRLASKEQAAADRQQTTDRLSKAIGADEEPLVLLRERFDVLVKSVGKDNSGKTIHEKLDELIDQVESGGGSGFGLGDLLGLRGNRGGRSGPKTKGPATKKGGAVRRFFGGQQGRDAKGRFTKGGGGFGAGKLLAGGVGAAAVGYLGYKAVDAFRDKDLTSYDPEALKQEAIAAREAGDTEYTEALKTQIAMQKKDVALQAGAQVAAVAGAGIGAAGGVKVAQKIGQTATAKKAAATVAKKAAPIAKAVKNKTWDLFIKFLKARAPKLAAKVGTRLAAAGAMATIPVAGWVGAAISLGFAASTAYDLYQLWKEFSALSDAEKETAASGKPSKEVNNWAYSVYIGKAKIEDVPNTYREQVEEILKKPPSNWKKPGATGTAAEKPKESAKPQTVAGAAAAGVAMAEAAAAKSSGGASTPSPTGPAAAIQAAKEPAMAAGGGATAVSPSKGPERRLGPAAAKRGKVDSGAAKNAALAAAAKYGITGPHLAQFMAQLDHESGGFKTVEENLRYSAKRLMEIFPKYYKDPAIAEQEANQPQAIANRVYANRMGNGPPESGDGYRYRGRGLIQLTGKDNYKRFGQLAGVDIVNNPDMAGNLGTAADIAAAFYKKNVIDKGIAGEDTAKVTKAINGGSIGLSHRESLFASYMKDPNALKAGPEAKPSAGGAEPEPSMVAKGQDVKVGGGGGGSPAEAQKQQTMTAQAGRSVPAAAKSAPAVTPKQDGLGSAATQQSTQYASNQVAMQATPAPVVVNNSGGASQQPIMPPKQNMPKASARATDNSFNRALAKDFSHPSAFTSVSLV